MPREKKNLQFPIATPTLIMNTISIYTIIKMWSFMVTLCICLATLGHGHSHLANPLPTRRLDCRAGNGRPRNCYGPCPPLDRYGRPTGVSADKPAERWRRGERRYISWHRNNHGNGESGFVRFTLVPIPAMMNRAAHNRFTFQISCWSSGLHYCRSRKEHICGNDAGGKAYRVPITVPSSYPDGVYAFGWSWYGAGDYRGKSYFGDYYSCSFIQIQGGNPVTTSSKSIFYPGLSQKHGHACMSAADRLGICPREPCNVGKVRSMRPSGLPTAIYNSDLQSYQRSPSRTPVNQPWRGAKTANKKKSFRVHNLQLYSIKTYRPQDIHRNKVRVRVSSFSKGFTVGLKISGRVRRVVFHMHGRSREELIGPFILNGDYNNRLHALPCRRGQKIAFRASVYGTNNERENHSYEVTCV